MEEKLLYYYYYYYYYCYYYYYSTTNRAVSSPRCSTPLDLRAMPPSAHRRATAIEGPLPSQFSTEPKLVDGSRRMSTRVVLILLLQLLLLPQLSHLRNMSKPIHHTQLTAASGSAATSAIAAAATSATCIEGAAQN